MFLFHILLNITVGSVYCTSYYLAPLCCYRCALLCSAYIKPSVLFVLALFVQGTHVYFIRSGLYLWFVPLFTEYLPVCFDYDIGLPSLLWWILIPVLCLWFGTWTKTLYLDPSDWLHLVLLLVCWKMGQWARAARENRNNYKPQRNAWPLILDTPNIQGIIRRYKISVHQPCHLNPKWPS